MTSFYRLRKKLKQRAAIKGLECSISAADLQALCKFTYACPACRQPFVDQVNHPHARSFDRIDSSLGYSVGNVDVLCRRCNSIKSVFDQDGETALLNAHPVIGKRLLKWIKR